MWLVTETKPPVLRTTLALSLNLQCSTKCGRGLQKRTVKCMKADHRGNLMDMEEAQCDAALKPPTQEYCNVHNPCPGDGKSVNNLCVLLCFKVSSRTFYDLPVIIVCIRSSNYRLYFHFRLVSTTFIRRISS